VVTKYARLGVSNLIHGGGINWALSSLGKIMEEAGSSKLGKSFYTALGLIRSG
jgi:hypothetical protein